MGESMNGDSGIRVRHLRKTFQRGKVQACRDVDLNIAKGELLVLLGPSGCGKTTTLRCIAGLEAPDNDDAIWVNGRNMTRVPPKDRHLAFVFQDTALFPHLDVRRNISFGLDMRKDFSRAEIDRRVTEAARMLQIGHLLERKPAQLSGGQGQRVALGRAIVMEPAAFLLDEPLANLDAALRVEMRTEIKRIQRKLDTTMLFVTHDQEEALSLGDKIAVIYDGVVQQVGTPRNIYLDPANLFVATFIGSPQLNRFACRLVPTEGAPRLSCALFEIPLAPELAKRLSPTGSEITLGIRPEFIQVGGASPTLLGRVALVELLGSRSLVFVEAQGQEIRVAAQGETRLREGEPVPLTLPLERAFFFGPDGTKL
jgi:multiple sugar transport system ATP-binding protein